MSVFLACVKLAQKIPFYPPYNENLKLKGKTVMSNKKELNGARVMIQITPSLEVNFLEVFENSDRLSLLQKGVGGYIERVAIPKSFQDRFVCDLWADDEGALKEKRVINPIASYLQTIARNHTKTFCPVFGNVVLTRNIGNDIYGFPLAEADVIANLLRSYAISLAC